MSDEKNTVTSNLISTSSLNGEVSLASTILSNMTKLKLKDLGIDTTDIKTEEDGQTVLLEAQKDIEEQNKKIEQEQKQKKADEDLHYRLRQLAKEMGIQLEEYRPVSEIIQKMEENIYNLDTVKQSESANIKANMQKREYQDILNRYLSAQKEEQKLDNNLQTIAYYNKLYQQMQF